MESPVRHLAILLTCTLVFISSVFAQQATTVDDVKLKLAPSIQSENIDDLEADTSVTILNRQGGWYQVQTPYQMQGWLKMLWLRFPVTGEESSVLSVFSQGSSGVTVATGIRGLSEDELATGHGIPFDMSTLKHYSVSQDEALAFAQEGQLRAQDFRYVD